MQMFSANDGTQGRAALSLTYAPETPDLLHCRWPRGCSRSATSRLSQRQRREPIRRPIRAPQPAAKEGPRINEEIRVREVQLIDKDGANKGVTEIEAAIAMAQEAGLDLVEIAPNSVPPVCKILDYGKYKYQAQKKAAEARKKQKVVEIKEIKLRPMIDDHDYDVKMRSMERFFEEGDKVKVTLRFRGREMAHQELGYKLSTGSRTTPRRSPRSSRSRASKAARWSWCWRRVKRPAYGLPRRREVMRGRLP